METKEVLEAQEEPQKKRKAQKGFTLIELLVVMAIIAILAAIAIPQYNKYRMNAMLSNAQSHAKSIIDLATGLASSAAQNPASACRDATTIKVITNSAKTGTTAEECTGDDCYLIAVGSDNSTICDLNTLYGGNSNITKPSWLLSVKADLTYSITGTGVAVTNGSVEVKTNYNIDSSHSIGCKYDPAADLFTDIDTTYVCKTNI